MEEEVQQPSGKEKFHLSPKAKLIINIVIDVVVGIILAFALLLAITTIRSKFKHYDQYTDFFGSAYLVVRTNSMAGDKEDNFEAKDIIKIDLITDSKELNELKVGDVITFKDSSILENGTYLLDTHRIQEIERKDGKVVRITTHGDTAPEDEVQTVLPDDVVGKFVKKSKGTGGFMLFMTGYAGFFVCIILPSLLIVGYLVFYLVVTVKAEKKNRAAAREEEDRQKRDKMREEIIAELGVQPQEEPQPAAEGQPAVEEEPAEPALSEEKVEEQPAQPPAAEEKPAAKPKAKKAAPKAKPEE